MTRSLERVDALAARLDTATAALVGALLRVESGNGSIGLLANDPALYERAVATLDGFEDLITDVRRNPKRYINISVF